MLCIFEVSEVRLRLPKITGELQHDGESREVDRWRSEKAFVRKVPAHKADLSNEWN